MWENKSNPNSSLMRGSITAGIPATWRAKVWTKWMENTEWDLTHATRFFYLLQDVSIEPKTSNKYLAPKQHSVKKSVTKTHRHKWVQNPASTIHSKSLQLAPAYSPTCMKHSWKQSLMWTTQGLKHQTGTILTMCLSYKHLPPSSFS